MLRGIAEEEFYLRFPRNFLVRPIFLETSNPSRHVRAPSGKTKVSLLQRALGSSDSLSLFLSRRFAFPPGKIPFLFAPFNSPFHLCRSI